MQISDNNLQKFIRLYHDEFGEILTIAEAREAASRVVDLYLLLAQKLPAGKGEAISPPS